jgi:signal transduction histidine kinase
MTLWYAGILLISVSSIAGYAFLELHRRDAEARKEAELLARHDRQNRMEWEENLDVEEQIYAKGSIDWKDVVDVSLWIGFPSALLSIVGGWWLMRKAFAPLGLLTDKAEKIQEYNLHEKLMPSGSGDELDRLTEVFNRMTARLDSSFQQIRDFTLHASHELKTPLTVLHGEMENALVEEPLSPAQRERLARQLDEIQRLARIVDSLSLLAKADAGLVETEREPVQLDEIVRDTVADTQLLGKSANIQVQMAACEPVTIQGDRHLLRELLLNLADNAIKYNRPNGNVEFSLRRHPDNVELKISNSGTGISAKDLPRIFDRFFRGDSSHSLSDDGCGLGLSIAQWIAAVHGGKLSLESVPGQQTIAKMVFPFSSRLGQDFP